MRITKLRARRAGVPQHPPLAPLNTSLRPLSYPFEAPVANETRAHAVERQFSLLIASLHGGAVWEACGGRQGTEGCAETGNVPQSAYEPLARHQS